MEEKVILKYEAEFEVELMPQQKDHLRLSAMSDAQQYIKNSWPVSDHKQDTFSVRGPMNMTSKHYIEFMNKHPLEIHFFDAWKSDIVREVLKDQQKHHGFEWSEDNGRFTVIPNTTSFALTFWQLAFHIFSKITQQESAHKK